MAEHEPRFTEALVVISHLPNGQLMAPSPTATRTQPDKRERVCSVPVKLVDKECPQGAQIDLNTLKGKKWETEAWYSASGREAGT